MGKQVVAITGAAGNLGSILAEGLLSDDVELHLLWHKRPLPDSLLVGWNTQFSTCEDTFGGGEDADGRNGI